MTAGPLGEPRQPVRTATRAQSIWKGVGEAAFRQNVVRLSSRASGIVWEPDVAPNNTSNYCKLRSIVGRPAVEVREEDARYRLPLLLERRLSDDFALLAATQEGVRGVSAACIEEADEGGLILRLAANGGVAEEVRRGLERIWAVLRDSTEKHEPTKTTQDRVFEQILLLSRSRIFLRIKSALGCPPSFRRVSSAGYDARDRLAEDLTLMAKKSLTAAGRCLITALQEIHRKFRRLTASYDDQDVPIEELYSLVKECFAATTTITTALTRITTATTMESGRQSRALFKDVLQESGLDPREWMPKKSIAQIEKIGSYWRIAGTLTRDVKTIAQLCIGRPTSLTIECIRPYGPAQSNVSTRGGPVQCFVHAEIQLLSYYNLRSNSNRLLPRTIGTSKLACFLCFLALSTYGGFQPLATHGRVYDHWTIPDVVEYGEKNVQLLRQTTRAMNLAIEQLCRRTHPARPFPVESRVCLHELPPASTATPSVQSLTKIVEADEETESSSEETLRDADTTTTASRELGTDGSSDRDPPEAGWMEVSDCVSEIATLAAVRLFVEAEANGRGCRVRLENYHAETETAECGAAVIVLEELEPGKDIVVANDQGSDMVLDFCRHLTEGVCRLRLRWS